MKQLLQDLKDGDTVIKDCPSPQLKANSVIISTSTSLISAGTERMLVGFGKASYLDKARQQPEKVKMVMEKVKTDGLVTTYDAVKSKLDQPIPLGYCNVGTVKSVGDAITKFKEGDRVVSNGPHSDVVRVPENLCAKIPENVSDEAAAFVVVGSIGLQGIRLAEPTLGETFVVIGVGLIGLLTVQLLIAHGCRVLAVDFDQNKLNLAREYGAQICNPGAGQDPVSTGLEFSSGYGVDGVIITASTQSNDPVTQAARMSRKRGRIILVGVVGLELNRADFYEKELTFQVSCSYGPGRYDSAYEDNGQDYPYAFVRWTEQRNFEAVLDMMSREKVNVDKLITHRVPFEEAPDIYETLITDKSGLGMLLQYGAPAESRYTNVVSLQSENNGYEENSVVLGVIGAGNYASRVLIPAFKRTGARLHTLVTSGGVNGVVHGSKAGFEFASTDVESLMKNGDVTTLVVVTQHDSHSSFVAKSINNEKHVFVEKPLAIDKSGLQDVRDAFERQREGNRKQLMVGFNRRFSPHVQRMKKLLDQENESKSFIMTMNAGAIPGDHWTQDPQVGGGRIIGEACHYIDLMRFLAGSKIISVSARKIGGGKGEIVTEDKASITLGFECGSFGTIFYLANGASSFPKERVEVFVGGKVLQLDNFRKLTGYGWKNFKKMKLWQQDKGQDECASQFVKAVETGIPAIPVEEIFEVADISIKAATILREQN